MVEIVTVGKWFILISGTLFFLMLPIAACAKKAYLHAGLVAVVTAVTLWLLWEPEINGLRAIDILTRAKWLSVTVLTLSPIGYLAYKHRERNLSGRAE